jgi:hypothetical protein
MTEPSLVFPETYDELAVLAHHGATEDELARRLSEREHMGVEERFHADALARAHVGPTIVDHRERWGSESQIVDLGESVELAGDGSGRGHALPPFDGEQVRTDDPNPAVPVGTMADVLNWVGADAARAVAAIAAERARDDPRSSLLRILGKITHG